MNISETSMQKKATLRTVKQFTSYSLNFEDVILNRIFPTKTHGFYVDVGAGHPQLENDLYAFYERGWRGINVEPNEGFFLLQQKMRPGDRNLCMVLSDTAGEPLTYYEIEGSGLSTCDEVQAREHASRGYHLRPRSVPVGTLAGILTEAGTHDIDVLKVDVEGFEEKVLSGNDWEKFRPSVVLVEATYPESPEVRPTSIRAFMEQRGYRHVHFDGLNDFYVEHGFPVPNDLTLPPNVFDRYILRQIVDLREQVASLRHEFESASTYAESLVTENRELREQVASLRQKSESTSTYAESLATENRRLGNQAIKLTNESVRYRQVAAQLRGELTALNSVLTPMHEMHEQLELLRAEMGRQYDRSQAECQNKDAELRAVEARLQAVYLSTSWLLTKPWRAVGRLVKKLVR